MTLNAYKLLHLIGGFALFLAFGAAIIRPVLMLDTDGRNAGRFRFTIALIHGFAMALILVAGFGMLARNGIHWPYPSWVWTKVGIWLLMGFSLSIAKRRLIPATFSMAWVILLGALSAYFGLFKA